MGQQISAKLSTRSPLARSCVRIKRKTYGRSRTFCQEKQKQFDLDPIFGPAEMIHFENYPENHYIFLTGEYMHAMKN